MNKFMLMAIEEAYKGIDAGDGGPFGAVIVKGGTVVGKGHNCVVKNNDPTAHGEIQAIRNACTTLGSFDLSGCELYTTAEPCPMCSCAIMWANIDKVYYGCTVKDTDNIGFRDVEFATKKTKSEEIERNACLTLFSDYVNIQDKTHY